MRYPAPDARARRARGPVQEIVHEDGRTTRRQLHVLTTAAMLPQLAVDLRSAQAHTPPVDGAEAP